MKSLLPKIKAPPGFYFRIKKDIDQYQILLYQKDNPYYIGRVFLSKLREGRYCTHSQLNYQYHNQGFGALMYAKAIQFALQNGWKVRSSECPSEDAKRVWKGKTLRKYFSIKTKKYLPNRAFDSFYVYAK